MFLNSNFNALEPKDALINILLCLLTKYTKLVKLRSSWIWFILMTFIMLHWDDQIKSLHWCLVVLMFILFHTAYNHKMTWGFCVSFKNVIFHILWHLTGITVSSFLRISHVTKVVYAVYCTVIWTDTASKCSILYWLVVSSYDFQF